jgi:hypothetical protein
MVKLLNNCIVLLSGWAGSGKDVAANLMCEEMGYVRLAFADPLRKELSEKTKLHIEYFSSPLLKDTLLSTPLAEFPDAKTYRDVVIEWAAKRRAIQDDVYSQTIVDVIRSGTAGNRIVVSDWRYLCEERTIREAFPDFTVIRIRIRRDSVIPRCSPSEIELDTFPMDAEIPNNGTISDLRAVLHHMPLLQHRF